MATKYYSFTGKVAWAKVVNAQETPWGKLWSVDLYLDEANQELYKQSGIRTVAIKEPLFPGEVGYKFKRPASKLIKGEEVDFRPPTVVDINDQPFEENIGNGSIVEVVVGVYETKAGKGHRLDSVKVLEHIPYVSNREVIRVGTNTTESQATQKPW